MYSTDASSVAIGAILLQDQGQGLLPLNYASRKLNSAEQQYSTEDREFLETLFATVKWRHYLAGGPKRAVCLTNHEPLKYLQKKKDLNKRQARWIKNIVDANLIIQWVPCKEQVVPDALSHRPDYGKYTLLIVEPNFLGNVPKCTYDHVVTEMAGQIDAATQATSNLRIVTQIGLDLLVRITNTGELQLVIPNAMGLCKKFARRIALYSSQQPPGHM